MIKHLYEITNRDRAPWDAETLLILSIARQSMSQKATSKDCPQPYSEFLDNASAEELNESVVSSFFNRFKGK